MKSGKLYLAAFLAWAFAAVFIAMLCRMGYADQIAVSKVDDTTIKLEATQVTSQSISYDQLQNRLAQVHSQVVRFQAMEDLVRQQLAQADKLGVVCSTMAIPVVDVIPDVTPVTVDPTPETLP